MVKFFGIEISETWQLNDPYIARPTIMVNGKPYVPPNHDFKKLAKTMSEASQKRDKRRWRSLPGQFRGR